MSQHVCIVLSNQDVSHFFLFFSLSSRISFLEHRNPVLIIFINPEFREVHNLD
jgi:hypothetical protein